MKVKLELLVTHTVTVDIVDGDLDHLSHSMHQLQPSNQQKLHSLKIVEVDDRKVGSSLDPGSALDVSNDQKMAKLHQLIPAVWQQLRKRWNSQSSISSML